MVSSVALGRVAQIILKTAERGCLSRSTFDNPKNRGISCAHLAIRAAAGGTPALRSIWATRPLAPVEAFYGACRVRRSLLRGLPRGVALRGIDADKSSAHTRSHASRFANYVPHLPPIAFGLFKRRRGVGLRLQTAVERKAFPAETLDSEQ